MESSDILEVVRREHGDLMKSAERALRNQRRAKWMLAGCCVIAVVAIGFGISHVSNRPANQSSMPTGPALVDALHRFSSGSPELIEVARQIISNAIRLDDGSMTVAIQIVGQSGIGLESEPWMRLALQSTSRPVMREALIWYPIIHPEFRKDPLGFPAYDQAQTVFMQGN